MSPSDRTTPAAEPADEDRWWAGEDGVTTGVSAPSFALRGLDVTVRVHPALPAAYDEAMARGGEASEVRRPGEQQPPASSLVHPAQIAALRWFEEHEAEVWAEIDRAAKELAQQEFEREAEAEERDQQRMLDELAERRRTNVPHGYDDDEYSRWDEDDDYAESLFDSFDEDPTPRKVKRPDPVDFEVHSVVVTVPDDSGGCAIMLQGNWSLDEEHGLGVIIEDGAIVELGPQSLTF